jgi:hypothetical protein
LFTKEKIRADLKFAQSKLKLSIHKKNKLEKKYQLHYQGVADDNESEA